MNLFFFHTNIRNNARMYCDSHLIKIITEIAQMLCSAMQHWEYDAGSHKDAPKLYKMNHKHHPMTLWVSSHIGNFDYTCKMGLALCEEYTKHYYRNHACEGLIEWLSRHNPVKEEYNGNSKQLRDSILILRSHYPIEDHLSELKYLYEQRMNENRRVCAYKHVPKGCTIVPLCMPSKYWTKDLIVSYRTYMIMDKMHFAEWRRERPTPAWVSRCMPVLNGY
jgi:hypothetical protein